MINDWTDIDEWLRNQMAASWKRMSHWVGLPAGDREELDIDLASGSLLCVDYCSSQPGYAESPMSFFDGRVLDEQTIERIGSITRNSPTRHDFRLTRLSRCSGTGLRDGSTRYCQYSELGVAFTWRTSDQSTHPWGRPAVARSKAHLGTSPRSLITLRDLAHSVPSRTGTMRCSIATRELPSSRLCSPDNPWRPGVR